MIKHCLALFIFFWLPRGLAEKVNMREAVQYAVTHSPALSSAKIEYESADLFSKNKISAMLPTLDLSATHGLHDTPSTGNSPYISALTLTLNETLYDNGVSLARYQIAQLKLRETRLRLKRAQNELCRQVIEQYLDYSLLYKTYQVRENQMSLMQKQYESVQDSYRQGLKTRKDFLRFKTQLSRIRVDVLLASATVEKSKVELRKLLGAEKDSQLEFIPAEAPAESDVPSQVLKIEDHDLYKIADLQRQANNIEVDIVDRRRWPELNFTAGAYYYANNYMGTGRPISEVDGTAWQAQVVLTYNFWDWGIRNREKKLALLVERVQDHTIRTQMMALEGDLQNLMLNLKLYSENLSLSRELLSLDEANYTSLSREYREGRLQYLDLVTGLNDLTASRINYFRASVDLYKASQDYKLHQGTLYEQFVQK